MRRYLLPPDFRGPGEIMATGKEARYLSSVLRLRPGDAFDGMDADGRPWLLTVKDARPGRVLIRAEAVDDRSSTPDERHGGLRTEISLFLCLTKGSRLDLAVRQATETGVRRILLLESENAVRREAGESGKARAERLARIVKEARQQSGSTVPTEVLPAIPLAEAPAWWQGRGPALYFHEAPLAETSLHRYLGHVPAELAILIGPEGGLSPAETALLSGAGWIPIHLGPTVLRAETAALYALAAAQTLIRERDSWSPRQDNPSNA